MKTNRKIDKKSAYVAILEVLELYNDILLGDYGIDIRDKIKDRIKINEIELEFGITIPVGSDPAYIRISDCERISKYGVSYNRTIAWSDDGRQPDNERLYSISFPTGAYIFGESYPTKIFNDFFVELKGYGPKYSDTANHVLYFTSENAKHIHNDFQSIFKKYSLLVSEENRLKRIASLKTELDKLEVKV